MKRILPILKSCLKINFILIFLTTTANAQYLAIVKGSVSFYHDKFDGRRTASGETFRQGEHTAAHPTWPFGTLVQVVNPENQNAILARINDRGPYANNRILDLSRAVAHLLGIEKKGHATLIINVLEWGNGTVPKEYRNLPDTAQNPR